MIRIPLTLEYLASFSLAALVVGAVLAPAVLLAQAHWDYMNPPAEELQLWP